MIKMKIGNRLLLAREERKINQAEMADILGVSPPTYSRLERNETSIELAQVLRFADILNIPVQDFLPETITLNNTKTQNGQGLVLGNIYNYYYSDQELHKENEVLNQKNHLQDKASKIFLANELFFWQIVELSGEDYQQAITILAQKSLSFILAFEDFIARKLYDLDKKTLAEQIYPEGNLSKDDFLYVRCYSLSQGKVYFEKVLTGEIPMLNLTFEPLLSLSEKAFFRKTSNEFPIFRTSVSYETGSNREEWK